MEYASLGFLGGAICALIMYLLGGVNGMDKNVSNGNIDNGNNNNMACGSDRGMGRDHIDVEKVVNTLGVLRMVATGAEKSDIDYAADCVLRIERLENWIRQREEV